MDDEQGDNAVEPEPETGAGPGTDSQGESVATPDDHLINRIVEKITPDTRLSRIELLTTVILAVASVLTAWSALQSAKWSGEQAIHFSEAGASRTESTRFDNRATSAILLDSQTFFSWGQALQTERIAADATGGTPPDPTVYDPANPSLSGYLFTLFRPDFQQRVVTWLEDGASENPEGQSPFEPFEAYLAEAVPAAAESDRLAALADESGQLAREDNQNSDNYVLTVVLLASVLFFAGISAKMKSRLSQNLMVFLAVATLSWAIVRLATLPIHAIP